MSEDRSSNELYHLELLVDIHGSYSIGYIPPVEDTMVAVASAPRQVLATLLAREGESLEQLRQRLDTAVGEAMASGVSINEVQDRGIEFTTQRRRRRRQAGAG